MNGITTVGLDLAKTVFQVHAVDAAGTVVARRQVRRAQMLLFFSRLSRCLIGMEACAGAHYRARELARYGHEVRLIPPSYVKPFVKRGKTDAADAEAVCTAVSQPSMRFVPVKTAAQQAMLQPFSNSSSSPLEIVIVLAPLRKNGPDHRYTEARTLSVIGRNPRHLNLGPPVSPAN